jgi:YidC/Oxa1 family membrane protein insertase
MNHSIVNLITAIVLSVAIIFGWQHFFEKPRLEKLTEQTKQNNQTVKSIKNNAKKNTEIEVLGRNEAIAAVSRVSIKTGALLGSISLKGLRFDDLTLRSYRQELDENSPPVELFSPSNSDQGYFAEIGWWSDDKSVTYPGASTVWKADKAELNAGESVNLSWKSPENVLFKVTVSLDENYMFTIKQATYNKSGRPISTQYYGLINRDYEDKPDNMVNILHQGMVGAVAGELQEFSYDKLKENKKESFTQSTINWFGITDKYWLAAFIPDKSEQYSANYNYALKAGRDKFQADFISSSMLI